MDWKLEVVCVPVSDIDRAKTIYAERVGFKIDYDSTFTDEYRVVQLTPPRMTTSFPLRWCLAGGLSLRPRLC
jgi:catechol 2,3-dioxygenase-like lactoylglutathione lyase family enzyme